MLFRAKQAVAATMEKVGGGVHGEKAAANASRSGNHKVEISCSLLELRAQDSIDHCHLQVILEHGNRM